MLCGEFGQVDDPRPQGFGQTVAIARHINRQVRPQTAVVVQGFGIGPEIPRRFLCRAAQAACDLCDDFVFAASVRSCRGRVVLWNMRSQDHFQ